MFGAGPASPVRYIYGTMHTVRRGRARAAGTPAPWLSALSAVLVALALLSSAARANAAEPGDSLTISLLTMGPGEHPFTKFGHSAIWVHDARTNRDEVYNFGTFDFDSPTLLLDSVSGKVPYWLSVQSLSGTLAAYRQQDRSLLASELALLPEERALLRARLRDNALPEHRYFRYDYYRDNCATRVRDALDQALGGRIRAHGSAPARMSYRAHTLRLVADAPLLYVALDLAVGRKTDSEITFWDEGFLPERLHDLVARTTVLRAGHEVPLINSERLLLPARLPEPRAAAPDWRARYWGIGLLLGAGLAWLGGAARANPVARVALGVASVALGILLGLLGCALCYLTFCSLHSAAAANYNVLLVPPWVLGLAVAGVAIAQNRAWAWRLTRWLAASALSSTALALGIHALCQHPQANGQDLSFVLPLWLGALTAAYLAPKPLPLGRDQSAPAPTATTPG